jgi:hypothetical protein
MTALRAYDFTAAPARLMGAQSAVIGARQRTSSVIYLTSFQVPPVICTITAAR